MSAINDFSEHSPQIDGPGTNMVIVTPDNANDLAHVSRALLFQGPGDVKVTTLGGQTLVIPSVQAGQRIDIQVGRVWATGSTVGAGLILSIW
jgi:hypothetical protein